MTQRVASEPYCPLCLSTAIDRSYFEDARRRFQQCRGCELVFVPPEQYLTCEQEKAAYDLHQNRPDDPQYRKFLSRLFDPLHDRLQPGKEGLDFGSGPGPTLSVMFEEVGHHMTLYDVFYANDASVFDRRYDFVTATEVLEHLHHPQQDLLQLWGCLESGGYLGIMTKLVWDQAAFETWHYKNDLTHVCFYSRATFKWLASQWKAELTCIGADVILLRKQRTGFHHET